MVVSTAVRADNPEVLAARARRIPVVPRAEMLAELMRLKQGIAIAGTHGKTTTTSLVASVLAEGGLDPTFVIGGRLNSAGLQRAAGRGRLHRRRGRRVRRLFLHLQPMIAMVTNIDADHMDTYGDDFAAAEAGVRRVPAQPAVLRSGGAVRRRRARARDLPVGRKPVVTYGLRDEAMIRAVDSCARRPQSRFHVRAPGSARGDAPLDVVLNLPGMHNVLNALAAIAVATELRVAG